MSVMAPGVALQAARAVGFLRERQLPHGEFTTLLGSDKALSNAVFDSSPFVTAFIAYALAEIDDAEAEAILKKAAGFLASEMEIGGVWRYWSTRQHKHARLPPDLDDTACISFALKRAKYPVPRNRWILRGARDRAGRFLTWMPPLREVLLQPRLLIVRSLGACQSKLRARRLVPPKDEDARFRIMNIHRNDVDPVVNANVVLYVGECEWTQDAIRFVIDSTLRGRPDFSLYYEDPLALYYAVARAARHSSPTLYALRDFIVSRVIERTAQAGLNSLQAAMAASILLTLESDAAAIPDLVRAILAAQRPDGGWDAYPFYNVWGSEELTTGFCLEVLARVSRARH